MEIQLTDFENAAFTVFVILLTRVILAFDLSLYIPLSKVKKQAASGVSSLLFFFFLGGGSCKGGWWF